MTQDKDGALPSDRAGRPPAQAPAGLGDTATIASADVDATTYNNSTPDRRGNWMQTYSGGQFWPLDMRPEEIHVADIAQALSNICRFGGHCDRFYSVAEHSVHVSNIVPPHMALAGLLHDATEAYVGDMIRPLKSAVPAYRVIEDAVWAAVAERFALPLHLPREIKVADNAVLLAEQAALMKAAPAAWCVGGEAAEVEILALPPAEARALFLARFAELARDTDGSPKGPDRSGLDGEAATAGPKASPKHHRHHRRNHDLS